MNVQWVWYYDVNRSPESPDMSWWPSICEEDITHIPCYLGLTSRPPLKLHHSISRVPVFIPTTLHRNVDIYSHGNITFLCLWSQEIYCRNWTWPGKKSWQKVWSNNDCQAGFISFIFLCGEYSGLVEMRSFHSVKLKWAAIWCYDVWRQNHRIISKIVCIAFRFSKKLGVTLCV